MRSINSLRKFHMPCQRNAWVNGTMVKVPFGTVVTERNMAKLAIVALCVYRRNMRKSGKVFSVDTVEYRGYKHYGRCTMSGLYDVSKVTWINNFHVWKSGVIPH